MRKVERSELLPLGEYEVVRARFRNRVIALKRARRVQLGQHLSLVFENHDTVLLQIQEMLRAERITDNDAIAHELETYNELIPEPGALSATLFVEYEDRVERRRKARQLSDLEQHLFLIFGAQRVRARFRRQPGEEPGRTPAVNYVTFEVSEAAQRELNNPGALVAIEVIHPHYTSRMVISAATRQQLLADLGNHAN
ncbi:MAG: DUF3501 family protein [Proteobacteria bacterium]|nr:DUF3501 family protein [Pseudomonadota bacterium]